MIDHFRWGGVPYKYISNSALGRFKWEGDETGVLGGSSSSESSDSWGGSTVVGDGHKTSWERSKSSLEPERGSGNDSLKSRARLGGWLVMPLALTELARDVLSVLTMLCLSASSTGA